MTMPAGTVRLVAGSSWGTFTIACTIPIAFLTGLYMYKIRKGRVVEASLLGAAAVLAATVIGNWIPGSPLERVFSLSREGTIVSMAIYGFIASVLPVWLLLCPRDYLSSFLKIGTVALLVAGVMIANPKLEAPAVNQHFVGGGGPYFDGPVFPFVCICIMCGAISGFHALVSSGTTPKMVSRESHVRLIGYGSMLIEGLVGVLALVVAAAMPQGDYWAINIDLAKLESFASTLEQMDAHVDNLAEIERQVGGESLRGRTGGAVTLAVGMSQILTAAVQRVSGAVLTVESLIKYWYHVAIMFEALFILTTIDTGTRIARFLLQEALGKFSKSFGRTDWLPGAVLTTAVVTFGWAALIWSGSIETIWPMFGIGNQLLAALALCLVTTVTIRAGRARYAWVTILPMLYVLLTTTLSAWSLCTGKFAGWVRDGMANGARSDVIRGTLNIAFIAIIFACVAVVIAAALGAWARALKQEPRDPAARGS
jgi:carbon starvation protein